MPPTSAKTTPIHPRLHLCHLAHSHAQAQPPPANAIKFVALTLLLTYNLLLRTTGEMVPQPFLASATADCFISSSNLRPALA
jgi:hypothetical protein